MVGLIKRGVFFPVFYTQAIPILWSKNQSPESISGTWDLPNSQPDRFLGFVALWRVEAGAWLSDMEDGCKLIWLEVWSTGVSVRTSENGYLFEWGHVPFSEVLGQSGPGIMRGHDAFS